MRGILPVLWMICAVASAAEKRPNILFVFTDDHSPNAIGAYNRWLKPLNPTPSIDKLASQGMVFERSYCTNSICGPVRAVIETGKHSHINGFRQNGERFNWDQPTFAKVLRETGYQTILYGKYHLGGIPQGYDDWAVLPDQGDYYNPDFLTPAGKTRIDGYCTDVVTDMAVKWLKEKRDPARPFLLRVQHKAPHRPWMPALRHLGAFDDVVIPEPPTLFQKHTTQTAASRYQEMEIDRHMDLAFDLFVDLVPGYRGPAIQKRQDTSGRNNMQKMTPEQIAAWRAHFEPRDREFHEANPEGENLVRWKHQRYLRNYLACVRGVDESVATLLATLDELGLAENTVVVYSSDQGFYLGERGWYDKRWMYENSFEMPLIIRWPGVVKPGSRNKHLVQNLDHAPTFLDMAGAKIPEEYQGRSLVPLLKGSNDVAWRDALYYHYYEHPGFHMVERHRGVSDGRYKLMHFYRFNEWEFYDLQADPAEQTNQYSNPEHAAEVARMKAKLDGLAKHYRDDTDISEIPAEEKRRIRPGEWE